MGFMSGLPAPGVVGAIVPTGIGSWANGAAPMPGGRALCLHAGAYGYAVALA